jgi:flagellar hook-length control protein FliK
MEMMPVIPMAVENLPNSISSEASAVTGGEGDFASCMAEFANIQNPEETQKNLLLPFTEFQVAGHEAVLTVPETDLSFPSDDIDTLMAGDESLYSAFFASVFQSEAMDVSVETGCEGKASQGELPILPENRAGVPLTTVLPEEAAILTDAMTQQVQVKNLHSGTALADQLSDNPAVQLPGADTTLNDKGLKNAIIPDSDINVAVGSEEESEVSQLLSKAMDEAVPGKAPVRDTVAGKGLSNKAMEQGSISMSSGISERRSEDSGEGIQGHSISSASESGLSEAAKGIVAQQTGQMDASLPDVNLAGASSHSDSSGRLESVGKEFVNVREGVEFYRLPSGELVDKNSVLDQVIHHVSLRNAQEGKTLTVRMHPQELGDLKLDLILENDKVRVNIQAQTHMVRDVLEQHLPHLRNALEAQGIRVGEMQLSLDSQQQSGAESFRDFSSGQDGLQQQFNHASQGGNGHENRVTETPPQEVLSGTQKTSQGGLSLRI